MLRVSMASAVAISKVKVNLGIGGFK